MKEIELTKGKITLVDDEDYEYLMQWKWHIQAEKYAARTTTYKHKGQWKCKVFYMHREIMKRANLSNIETQTIDHVNVNPLDNRRCNLRLASYSENNYNRPISKNNTSGYKGICWDKSRNAWIVRIGFNGKTLFQKRYKNFSQARLKRQELEQQYHKEFAYNATISY